MPPRERGDDDVSGVSRGGCVHTDIADKYQRTDIKQQLFCGSLRGRLPSAHQYLGNRKTINFAESRRRVYVHDDETLPGLL